MDCGGVGELDGMRFVVGQLMYGEARNGGMPVNGRLSCVKCVKTEVQGAQRRVWPAGMSVCEISEKI